MFKEVYGNMNRRLRPDREVVERVLAGRKSGRRGIRPLAAALAALALCVLGGVPVLAANVPEVNDILYYVTPGLAQLFKPVRRSSENNGIRMEVVSAYIHGNTAEVYLTLEDLTGDRVDATTDLFDSYTLRRPFDSTGHCERVGFDEATGKAMFLVTMEEWGDHPIAGDKVTFRLGHFLSKKAHYDSLTVALDFSSLGVAESRLVESPGGGGAGYQEHVEESRMTAVLVPGAPLPFPVEGVDLTGAGYVDGLLHIQTAVTDNQKKDNHGDFTLTAPGEGFTSCLYNVYTREGDVTYVDYVFDIPQEELGRYTLQATFTTSGCFTQGPWEVTIPLEEG